MYDPFKNTDPETKQRIFKYKREFSNQKMSPEVAWMRAIEKVAQEDAAAKQNNMTESKETFKDFLVNNHE